MAKRRIATLPDGSGRFTIVFDDGTTLTVDSSGNIVGQDDSPNPLRAAAFRSGSADDEAAQARIAETTSAENARRFDQELASRNRQNRQQYEANMLNARTQQEQAAATREYQRAQTELAKQRLAFDERNSNADRGLRMVETAAQLRGPANFFQSSEYMRGVSSNPQTATFLSALQNGTQMAGYGAQGGLPERETIGTLTAKLGGGTGLQNGAPTEEATLAQIGNIAAKGAHQIGAGGLEQLTSTERELFGSGLDRLGIDKKGFLEQYARSRIGNRYGNVA